MQPNKTKIALIIGAMYLGVSGASMAATGSFNITATTIADVVLTQTTPLNFGTNIFSSAGTCTMNAANPAQSVLQIDTSAAQATATAYGDLTGGGCINGAALGTPGVYKITGTSPGSTVNITLNGITTTDYTFTPNSGAISSYGATGAVGTAGDDTTGSLTTASVNTFRFPDATEAAEAEVTANEIVFTLGGTITVLNPLTANTLYNTDTFVVNVVY